MDESDPSNLWNQKKFSLLVLKENIQGVRGNLFCKRERIHFL